MTEELNYRFKNLTATCTICKKEFKPFSTTQKVCRDLECRQIMSIERDRRAYERRKLRQGKMTKKTCIVCGKEFETKYPQKKICGDEVCLIENEKKVDKEYNLNHQKGFTERALKMKKEAFRVMLNGRTPAQALAEKWGIEL